jgi:hypothetical protein
MRKNCFRFTLVVASALGVMGAASAQTQTVNFWFNSLGDTATNQPPVIDVISGTQRTFSVYVKTTNIGALAGINMMFGYSTATSTGTGATPLDTKASFVSWTWAQADLTSGQAQAQLGGGGGPAAGVTRPYGFFGSTINLGNTFAGTGDNVNFKIGDITLNINAAPGNVIPISIWSFGTTDNFASAVVNANSAEFFPSAPYTATLNVVPEPGTLAALGLGAIVLLRRRRK